MNVLGVIVLGVAMFIFLWLSPKLIFRDSPPNFRGLFKNQLFNLLDAVYKFLYKILAIFVSSFFISWLFL